MEKIEVIETGIRYGEKFTARVRSCEHPVIKKRINKLSEIDYNLYVHNDEWFEKSSPVFTLILTVHDANIEYVRDSLRSVFWQTYDNTEVILINNGANGVVGRAVWQEFIKNKNAKLIRVPENLYNPKASNLDDPMPNLWNAGLFCSAGDFVYFMAYDDFLSRDYVKRMVDLFTANERCNTAAPSVVSVDESSRINEEISANLMAYNQRDRYTDGVFLAKSYMRGANLIQFPGGLLASKSDLVLSCGGFDQLSDLSQIFKIGIHGVSGFDPKATLYWRHHAAQTNKFQTQMGLVYFKTYRNFLEDYDIKTLHQNLAGDQFSDQFIKYIDKKAEYSAIQDFRNSYRFGLNPGMKALGEIFQDCPLRICMKVLPHLFLGFPAYFYWNYLPQFAKNIYRKWKPILISLKSSGLKKRPSS
jgi:hypothetical protein